MMIFEMGQRQGERERERSWRDERMDTMVAIPPPTEFLSIRWSRLTTTNWMFVHTHNVYLSIPRESDERTNDVCAA